MVFVQASARLRAIRYLLVQLVNFDEIVDTRLVNYKRGDDREADGTDEIAPDASIWQPHPAACHRLSLADAVYG